MFCCSGCMEMKMEMEMLFHCQLYMAVKREDDINWRLWQKLIRTTYERKPFVVLEKRETWFVHNKVGFWQNCASSRTSSGLWMWCLMVLLPNAGFALAQRNSRNRRMVLAVFGALGHQVKLSKQLYFMWTSLSTCSLTIVLSFVWYS